MKYNRLGATVKANTRSKAYGPSTITVFYYSQFHMLNINDNIEIFTLTVNKSV